MLYKLTPHDPMQLCCYQTACWIWFNVHNASLTVTSTDFEWSLLPRVLEMARVMGQLKQTLSWFCTQLPSFLIPALQSLVYLMLNIPTKFPVWTGWLSFWFSNIHPCSKSKLFRRSLCCCWVSFGDWNITHTRSSTTVLAEMMLILKRWMSFGGLSSIRMVSKGYQPWELLNFKIWTAQFTALRASLHEVGIRVLGINFHCPFHSWWTYQSGSFLVIIWKVHHILFKPA